MKKNRKKIKLIIIFIFGFSSILIFISLASTYSSGKAILNLAKYAYLLDQQNNKKLSSDLFFAITEETVNLYSEYFKTTAILVSLLATEVQKQLTESQNFDLKKNSVNLTKYKNRNFFVDSTQNTYNTYYWGNKNKVPMQILKELNSLKSIGKMFIDIENMYPGYYYGVYVISTDYFHFAYPIVDSYYKNIKDASEFALFYKFNKFPLQIKDKSRTKLPCIFERPYKDASGNLVLSVETGIYNKGKLIAHVGIDIDFKKISRLMLTNPVPKTELKTKNGDLVEGFLFLLSKEGNIIIFPEKYANLFSLPKEYLNMINYLKENTIKLSSSEDPEVKALSQKIKNKKSGIEEITLKEVAFDIAYSEIKPTGWTLCYVIEKQYLLSPTIQTKKLLRATIEQLFKKNLYITLVFIILSFVFMFFIFRHFLQKPIKKIQYKIKKMGNGHFNINLKEEGAAEIAELAAGFNFMDKELRSYIDNLKKETAASQTLETEIRIAEKIQRTILPDPTSFPTNGKFQLAARLNAAKNVSGDFYDFFYLNKNKIAILIADVSGKGLQAAFFMATSKALIKNQCFLEHDDPGKVLEHVNKVLCMDNKAQMFVTVCLAFCNITDGTVIYANAGHHAGMILRNNQVLRPENFKNIALGIYDKADYKTGNTSTFIGDKIFLYTDGVPEAVSPEGEEYGEERLKKLILTNKNQSLNILCDIIIKDVNKFEENSRFDDITLLAFKRMK
jgi:serine phosphatase RsbU (regulator of sigma subunit)